MLCLCSGHFQLHCPQLPICSHLRHISKLLLEAPFFFLSTAGLGAAVGSTHLHARGITAIAALPDSQGPLVLTAVKSAASLRDRYCFCCSGGLMCCMAVSWGCPLMAGDGCWLHACVCSAEGRGGLLCIGCMCMHVGGQHVAGDHPAYLDDMSLLIALPHKCMLMTTMLMRTQPLL